jgi:hypothetical protein
MLANTEEESITSFPLIDQKQSLFNEPLVRLLFETGERGMNTFSFSLVNLLCICFIIK